MKILIAGGGTGGHLFPALALAEEVKAQGGEVLLVGSGRKIEKLALARRSLRVVCLKAEGLVGRPFGAKVRALRRIGEGVREARRLIKAFRPQVVFGVGGYASFPLVLAARLSRIPAAIHEQNSIPGLANRILGKMAQKIFISFKASFRFFPRKKTILSGNPVRTDLFRPLPREHEGVGLLVTGGSQGARFINQLMIEVSPRLFQALPNLYLLHQTGFNDYELVAASYRSHGFQVKVYPFIEDMAWAYAQADLVLCRAGATTIAELSALGKPAIFIPFPYATHNHQEENARYVVDHGGGVMYRQAEIRPEGLVKKLVSLLTDRDRRLDMGQKIRKVMPHNALEIILAETEALLDA